MDAFFDVAVMAEAEFSHLDLVDVFEKSSIFGQELLDAWNSFHVDRTDMAGGRGLFSADVDASWT